jgi:hypothetical protein
MRSLEDVYTKTPNKNGLRKWGVEYQQNDNSFLQLNEEYKGIDFDFRMYGFDEPGSKKIRAYGWSCRVTDTGQSGSIKAIVSGTVYSKLKNTSISERDLILSADADSDLTTSLMKSALRGFHNFLAISVKNAKGLGEEPKDIDFDTYLNNALDAQLLTLIELYDLRDDADMSLIIKIVEFSCITLKSKLKRPCFIFINRDSTNFRYSRTQGLPKILEKIKSNSSINFAISLAANGQFRKSISDIAVMGLSQ